MASVKALYPKTTLARARKVVTIAYLTILERNPDKQGLEMWSKKYANGEIDDIDLAYNFFMSAEYQARFKKESKTNLIK